MKQFEIRTPALKAASEAALNVIAKRPSGEMDHDEARDLVASANAISRAVATELQVRIAMPKLTAIEAKQIEAETTAKIEAA